MEEHVDCQLEGEDGGEEDLKRMEEALRWRPVRRLELRVGARLEEVAEDEEGGELEGEVVLVDPPAQVAEAPELGAVGQGCVVGDGDEVGDGLDPGGPILIGVRAEEVGAVRVVAVVDGVNDEGVARHVLAARQSLQIVKFCRPCWTTLRGKLDVFGRVIKSANVRDFCDRYAIRQLELFHWREEKDFSR